MALSIVGIVLLKVGLVRGFPHNSLAVAFIVLAFGYLLFTVVKTRMMSISFGLSCMAFGFYAAWYSPANIGPGALACICGLLVLSDSMGEYALWPHPSKK
jgi:hypothetical protein